MHWVKLTFVCRHNFSVYSWVAGHSSWVSHAFDLKIFAKFTFMKMFYSTSASRVFLPSKHITGHFSMNSFIFQIVVLWSSALFSHKQNGVSSLLLSMFFQGPRRSSRDLRGSSDFWVFSNFSLDSAAFSHFGAFITWGFLTPPCYPRFQVAWLLLSHY